jgi:hypothetical protein
MMRRAEPSFAQQPLVVALAGWTLPGLGYLLIGQRARGVTVGVTVVTLFVMGLLIGGVRSLEVPTAEREDAQRERLANPSRAVQPRPRLLDELRNKPWSIAQVMNGPIGIAAGFASIWAGTPKPVEVIGPDGEKEIDYIAPGIESHARVNEIAVLYTAVAGMLNLLTMIDSASRAGRMLDAA